MNWHTNPPAFPRSDSGNHGMTLRDWFAGQALAGLMSRDFGVTHDKCAVLADIAYTFADAMLDKRAKTEGHQ
jgi:hypothetical protein